MVDLNFLPRLTTQEAPPKVVIPTKAPPPVSIYPFQPPAPAPESEPVAIEAADVDTFSDVVTVGEDDFVLKEDFDKLSPENQKLLTELGIEAYNSKLTEQSQEAVKAVKQAQAEFEAKYTKIKGDQYVLTEDFDKLDPAAQKIAKEQGIEALNKYIDAKNAAARWQYNLAQIAQQQAFNAQYFMLADGTYVSRDEFNKLSPEDQQYLYDNGVEAFNQYSANQYQEYLNTLPPDDPNMQALQNLTIGVTSSSDLAFLQPYWTADGYNVGQYLYDNSQSGTKMNDAVKSLLAAGFSPEDLNTMMTAMNNAQALQMVKAADVPAATGSTFDTQKLGGHEVIDELMPYANSTFTQVDLVRYLADNNNSADAAKLAGVLFKPETILAAQKEAARTIARKGVTEFDRMESTLVTKGLAPTMGDYVDNALMKVGISKQDVIDLNYIFQGAGGEIPVTAAQQAKWDLMQETIKTANAEYIKRYGRMNAVKGNAAPLAAAVFAPARALRPDVTLSDIRGAEWAIGAGQVLAVAAMPFGGITGGIVGKALDVGASAAFGAATALDWKGMTTAGKIASVVGNLGFLVIPYAAARFGSKLEIAKAMMNPDTRAMIKYATEAGEAAKTAKTIKALTKLEDTSALHSPALAGRLQTAEGMANLKTKRFIDAFEHLDEVSPNLLKYLEKKSGMAGFSKVSVEVGKAAKRLKSAQEAYDYVVRQVPQTLDTAEARYLSHRAVSARAALRKAQDNFDKAMLKYADAMSGVRFKNRTPSDAVLFDEYINQRASAKATTKDIEAALEKRANDYQSTFDDIADFLGGGGEDLKAGYEYRDNAYWRRYDPLNDDPTAMTQTTHDGTWIKVSPEEAKKPAPSRVAVAEKQATKEVKPLEAEPKKSAAPEPESGGASQKVFVTKRDEQELFNLNFPKEVIAKMTPQEVVEAIAAGKLFVASNVLTSSAIAAQPITMGQLELGAYQLGMTDGEVQQSSAAGVLPQAVVFEAVKLLPAYEAKLITQAVVTQFPDIGGAVYTIPQVAGWRLEGYLDAPLVNGRVQLYPDIESRMGLQPLEAQAVRTRIRTADLPETKTPIPEKTIIGEEYKIPPPDGGKRGILLDNHGGVEDTEELKRQFAGGVALKAGMGYWVFRDPYRGEDNRHFFREDNLPPRIIKVGAGKGSGYASIQQFIDDHKITDFDVNIGFEAVSIHEPSRQAGRAGAVEYRLLTMPPKRGGKKAKPRIINVQPKKPKIIMSRGKRKGK